MLAKLSALLAGASFVAMAGPFDCCGGGAAGDVSTGTALPPVRV